jgi:hypothetical protein
MKYNFINFEIQSTLKNICMTYQNKRLGGILVAATGLLLIPAISMLFNSEVKWGIFDFIVAGALLWGTGLLIETVLRRVKSRTNRILLCAVIVFLLLLVWAELAVGIFGTAFAGS